MPTFIYPTCARFAPIPLILLAASLCTPAALSQGDEQTRKLSRDIFKQLIEINTTDSIGSTTIAAEAMAKRLRDEGFPSADVVVLGPNSRKGNMVARLHGTGAHKPVLLIGHIDVVEARREDWTTNPFEFVEKDGYYYGRGTQDMKDGDAIMVTTLIRMFREGYKPNRDIILALTADEEGGQSNGIDWLLKNHRDLVDAEFVLNHDGGGVDTKDGKPLSVDVDASEKLYADYQLIVTNPGGHSSLPSPDNAVYHLAGALTRLAGYTFPFELNSVTRAYFERMTTIETGSTAADMRGILQTPPDQAAILRLSQNPSNNASIHTTCVTTRLLAGHANNALPQMAQANVNCRILPGHSREEVRRQLIGILDDPKIVVRYVSDAGDIFDKAPDAQALPPTPLRPDVMRNLEAVAPRFWEHTPVIPTMANGASDGVYTNAAGLPTYGISGVAIDIHDQRAHGKDERVLITSYDQGVDFFYQYLRALTK